VGLDAADAYPDRHFAGRIEQILPQVDPTTRTWLAGITAEPH
jgi:multidrug efflux pump subunit AcrA (membrane-fusion protein)